MPWRGAALTALALGALGALYAPVALAQAAAPDPDGAPDEAEIEVIAVTGTQIKGAAISESLSLSVLDSEEIDLLGPSSGDELLALFPEHGQNFFSTAEDISGGVNSARGDIGAFNLRNLGTGNTLVLLNGRRMVNASTYQTEMVGGSFVPVTTVNSNQIPVLGLGRVEILKDGASAIYGADAVAGVVNNVMKKNLRGTTLQIRGTQYANLNRTGETLALSWGDRKNRGQTKYGFYLSGYTRGRVNSQEDPRWANSDLRPLLPDDSPWKAGTAFRNTSVHSKYGQFDLVAGASSRGLVDVITDSAGEFETHPAGTAGCEFEINQYVCGSIDGTSPSLPRHNFNENRDLSGELERLSFFGYFDHTLPNGMDVFTELSLYSSKSNIRRHASYAFSNSAMRVGRTNYYNPLGPTTRPDGTPNPNRLPDSVLGQGHSVSTGGLTLGIDTYRYTEAPRIVDVEAWSYRFLQGVRGTLGDWDWEGALVVSEADRDDITRNRISNTLMQEALNDPTENAYNPFSAGVNTNIQRALVNVYRYTRSGLLSIDGRISNHQLFELAGGPAALLAGAEFRRESFEDDRDPRLDGTIRFTSNAGVTFPFVSDVMNSSPTPDNRGGRNVVSLFTELQLPVLESLDMQFALRFEDFSDISLDILDGAQDVVRGRDVRLSDLGTALVGKWAFGWRPFGWLLLRGSVSQAYRVPNLVTINETVVVRNRSRRRDWVCQYALDNGQPPSSGALDCEYTMQRRASGSHALVPEESVNTSFGILWQPHRNLRIQMDYWRITKENTIGLIGENNHTLLQLVQLRQHGNADCSTLPANANVGRENLSSLSNDEAAIYTRAGLCPVAPVAYVSEVYTNLDTRILAGYDLSLDYRVKGAAGTFSFKYNVAIIDRYDQEPDGVALELLEAQRSGLIPFSYGVSGFQNLIGRDGNQEMRSRMILRWYGSTFGFSLAMNEIGEFYQSSLTRDDGTRYVIPAFQTLDATFTWTIGGGKKSPRLRLGIKNLTDERAPLADRNFGYFADAHTDWGMYSYLDVRLRF